MATIQCVGYARTNTGSQIPLSSSMAEGTETTLTTDATVTVTAQDVGTYMPGATITSIEVFGLNNISYAYVLRQGVILSWASVNVQGVSNNEMPLCAPVQLRPGDTIRVLAQAAAGKVVSLCTYSNNGVARIFTGTRSGSAASTTTQLNDLQNADNNIGDTLQNSTVIKAMLTGVVPTKGVLSSGGAWIRNASSQIAGVVPLSNPAKCEPMISDVNIPISFNWTASIVTDES